MCSTGLALCFLAGLGCSGNMDAAGSDEYEMTEDVGEGDDTALDSELTGSDAEASTDAETADELAEFGTLPQALLSASSVVQAFDVTVRTGNDDLRGGNDNAFITFFFDDGRTVQQSINDGFRLADRTSRFLRVPVAGGARFSLLGGIEICGTMRGGFGGDNWNIDGLTVTALSSTSSQTVLNRSASPLARLTGDRRCVFFAL